MTAGEPIINVANPTPNPQWPTVLDMAPMSTQALLAIGLVGGLVLWLFGGKMIRPLCAAAGLAVASLVAAAMTRRLDDQYLQLGLIIASGLLGGVLAFFLFRLWMGLSCAAILVVVAPTVWLVTDQAKVVPLRDVLPGMKLESLGPEPPPEDRPKPPTEGIRQHATDLSNHARTHLDRFARDQIDQAKAVWSQLAPEGSRILVIAAIAGGIAGLIAGLMAPYAAATFQSAFVGGLLILGCGHLLIREHVAIAPSWLADSPRPAAALLGLITLAGVGLQWMFRRRKADT